MLCLLTKYKSLPRYDRLPAPNCVETNRSSWGCVMFMHSFGVGKHL